MLEKWGGRAVTWKGMDPCSNFCLRDTLFPSLQLFSSVEESQKFHTRCNQRLSSCIELKWQERSHFLGAELKILPFLDKDLLTFNCFKSGVWKLEPLRWLVTIEKFGSNSYICLQRANIRQKYCTKEHVFSDIHPYGIDSSLSERVLIVLTMTWLNTRVCMEGDLKENKNEVGTWHYKPRSHSSLTLLQAEEFVLLAKRWWVLDKIILYLEISGEQNDWQFWEKEKKLLPWLCVSDLLLGSHSSEFKKLAFRNSVFNFQPWKMKKNISVTHPQCTVLAGILEILLSSAKA